MTRLRLPLMVVAYMVIFVWIAFTQQGGTVRGQIVDTTERQNPIEGVEVVMLPKTARNLQQRQMRM